MKNFSSFIEVVVSISIIAFFIFIVAAVITGNTTLLLCGGISMGVMVVSGGIYSAN